MHSRFQEIATKDQTDLVQRREKDSFHGLAYLLSAPPAPGARHGCLIQPESRRYTASSPSPLAVAAPGPASNPRLGAPYTSRYAVGAQPSAHHPLAWLAAARAATGWSADQPVRGSEDAPQTGDATASAGAGDGGVSRGRHAESARCRLGHITHRHSGGTSIAGPAAAAR